jgi:hypothetical protein
MNINLTNVLKIARKVLIFILNPTYCTYAVKIMDKALGKFP